METYEGPSGGEYAVMEVDFSGKKGKELRTELASYLKKEIDHALNERTGLEKKMQAWADQANSRRKRPDAGPLDSNVDMPLTRERMTQVSSRLINPIFQQDQLFVCMPRRPSLEEDARKYEKLIDYIVDRVPFMQLCDELLEQAMTFPCGVVKTPWITKRKKAKRWQEIDEESYADLKEAGYTTIKTEGRYFLQEDYEIDIQQGAFPELIPIEDFIFAPGASCIDEAEWIVHRLWMTKAQIKARIRESIYEKDALESIGEPAEDRKRIVATAVEEDDSKQEPSSKQYEILEIYCSYDINEDDEDEELIVTMDRTSGTILRAVHNFYHNYQRPFVTWAYKRRNGSIYGDPLTFMLEPLHVAYSASTNQRLDAAIRANNSMIIGPKGSDLRGIFENGIVWGYHETTADISQLKEFKVSQPYSQLPELENRFSNHADKLSSLSDYSFAIEQISRPTATGQVQLIEEGKQPLYMLLESFRSALAQIVMHMLSRYRQFYPAGLTLYNQITDGDSEVIVAWPDEAFEESVIIETKVSSQNMSKNVRKQEILAFVDKIPQIYQTMSGMAQMVFQGGPMAPFAAALLRGYQIVVDRMLTEFEIAKKDELNPQTDWMLQVGQEIQQLQAQVQQLGQQAQMASQQAQMATQENTALKQFISSLPGAGASGPEGPMAPPPGGPSPQGPGF